MLTAQFFITTGYGALSFYVYTLEVLMMFRRWNEYNTTFFKIFIIEYFFNLLTFINSFVTLRAPQNTCNDCLFSFLFEKNSQEEDNFPLQIFFTLHYSMAFIQYSMTFLISLNRLSMVILVNSYEKWWRPTLPFIILGIAIFPFAITWPLATSNAYFLYTPPLGGYITKTAMDATEILSFLVTFMVVVTALTAVANILAIFRLGCLPTRISGAEKNLFAVSFTAFLVQLFALGDTLILRYASPDANSMGTQTAKVLMPFVSDLLTFNHPWALIIFSSKVRQSMANDHFPSLKNKSAAVTSSVY